MITNGKIILFNKRKGTGVIETPKNKSYNFIIKDWDDIENKPSLGMNVIFLLKDETALNIIANDIIENKIAVKNEIKEDFTKTEEEAEPENYLIGPKLNKISLSLNVTDSISNYFNYIKENIDKRNSYKKIPGSLDYVLIHRFLQTTFNNLTDIDLNIITPTVKSLQDDLIEMSDLYNDFSEKTDYPQYAYSEVFLTLQTKYKRVKSDIEFIISKLNRLRTTEENLSILLKVKKKRFKDNTDDSKNLTLRNEIKSLNGAYADTIHMMAEIDERRKHDLNIAHEFEETYKSEFNDIFKQKAIVYKKDLIFILNAQAYIFDFKLWQEAKGSKLIKAHFEDSPIKDNLNTQTYLKYYIDSLDKDKANEDSKKLIELLHYLQAINKEYVLVIVSSTQDAIEHSMIIKKFNKEVEIKSFVDEKEALKLAKTHNIKILIIEDILKNMPADRFLQAYKKSIFQKPEIILLGNKAKSLPYKINKVLSKNISSKIISNTVKDILS